MLGGWPIISARTGHFQHPRPFLKLRVASRCTDDLGRAGYSGERDDTTC